MASQPPMMELPPVAAGMGISDFSNFADATQLLPSINPAEREPESAINKLKPGSELHTKTLQKLEAMFRYSSQAMSNHSARWGWMEQKIQAYISLPDYEQLNKQLENNRGAAPEVVKVIVPYSYATIHAAATFLSTVLLGRRPIFPLLATSGTDADKAQYMESALQANLEATKAYEVLWQFIWDSLIYSFGATRIGWLETQGKVLTVGPQGNREVRKALKYAGNKLNAIDPYAAYPDPRVPMHECNEKGDFFFWSTQQSKMILKDMERSGIFKWVDKATDKREAIASNTELPAVADSKRRARIGAMGNWMPAPADVVGFWTVREGTVRLVPKDWGLGDSEESELWKFTWVPNRQIIQAEPQGNVHQKHPVVVTEPTSFGHEFGSLSMGDMIGPFQDILSWLINSRMENVRVTMHNQFVADPARIEMQDLRSPAAGKVIRLKAAAMGTPVNDAIRQLMVQDHTQGHVNDIQLLRMLADSITGINDNMRGINTTGGRRSATEARMSMQAGASRLSQLAIRISSQGFMGLAEQMIQNIQQYMPEEMWAEMTGDDGQPQSTLLTPDMIMGTFSYQISDGSLPHDKMALLEVWEKILMGVASDPELRATHDVNKIFDHIAELGGAKNISSFKRASTGQPNIMAPGQEPPQGAVPVGGAMPPPPASMVAGALS
jgi:hypothetical protein